LNPEQRRVFLLVSYKGIFSTPNVKPGEGLPPATTEMVKQFYMSDEINRIMPGTKIMFLLTHEKV
jgi:hypothetical protein